MPDPKPHPSTATQAANGLDILKQLVKQSAAANASPTPPASGGVPPPSPTLPTQPAAPPIDTGSIGGLLSSLKDRLSYAMFGPSTSTPPPPAPPKR